MKNIHVLPTDKPSRLSILNSGKLNFGAEIMSSFNSKPQNIYITSDEEIKEDYVIAYGVVIKVMMFDKETLYFVNGTKAKKEDCKKMILTTDQDLIKDGVQAIDDDFLEWFVKNPSCEEVEIGRTYISREFHKPIKFYKIIYPKEEPKQETLEETAVRLTDTEWLEQINKLVNLSNVTIHKRTDKNGNTIIKWSNNSKPKQETLEGLVGKMKITDDKVDLFAYSLGLKEGAKWQQEVSQHIVPFDAYNIEVFKIEADENGELFAYIGYRVTNGNFHFSVVPFTEPQQDKNKYSEEEVLELIQFLAEREDFKENSSMSIFIAQDFLQKFKNK